MLDQIKQFIKSSESELILALGVILISLISFAAGRITVSTQQTQPIGIEYLAPTLANTSESAFQNNISDSSLQEEKNIGLAAHIGIYVGSKNSNKYHLPNCSGAKRIKEKNKIWFNSKEEAEGVGYTPAANCPGL